MKLTMQPCDSDVWGNIKYNSGYNRVIGLNNGRGIKKSVWLQINDSVLKTVTLQDKYIVWLNYTRWLHE